MTKSAALLLVAALTLATPAHADWQFTKWGMSPEQLVKASDGKAMPTTRAEIAERLEPVLLKMPWQSGDFQFMAYFRFKANKLDLVRLDLQQGDPGTLLVALKRKYGEPEVTGKAMAMALWRTAIDQISWGNEGVRYFPRVDSDNSNL